MQCREHIHVSFTDIGLEHDARGSGFARGGSMACDARATTFHTWGQDVISPLPWPPLRLRGEQRCRVTRRSNTYGLNGKPGRDAPVIPGKGRNDERIQAHWALPRRLPGLGYPFMPVNVIPSMKVRWARKKKITMGTVIIVLTAIKWG